MRPARAGLTGQMVAILPAPMSRMFGRDAELATLVELLVDSPHRLITVTGLGGCGKSRLAIEAARRVQPKYAHGAVFVDLSALGDATALADELCRQLGLGVPAVGRVGDWLCSVLANREQLVVIDGMERFAATAPLLSTLASSCPGLSLLVTSRRALGLDDEQVLVLAPLPVADGEAATGSAAVALYCDRARAVDLGFATSADTLCAVAAICRRLDGLPLAIELAAARSRTLRPPALLARLTAAADAPWTVLGGASTAPGPALLAAIGWSIEQLTPPELALFGRLSVFAGAFSTEGAEAIGADDAETGLSTTRSLGPGEVLDGLCALVDLHLVEPIHDAVDGAVGGERYRYWTRSRRPRVACWPGPVCRRRSAADTPGSTLARSSMRGVGWRVLPRRRGVGASTSRRRTCAPRWAGSKSTAESSRWCTRPARWARTGSTVAGSPMVAAGWSALRAVRRRSRPRWRWWLGVGR